MKVKIIEIVEDLIPDILNEEDYMDIEIEIKNELNSEFSG